MLELDAVLRQEQSASHSKPPIYEEEGKLILRASCLGVCPLKVALRGIGKAEHVSDSTRDAWAKGHEHERIVKYRLKDRFASFEIVSEQDKIEHAINPACIIRGHTDGRGRILTHSAGLVDVLIEGKSMHEDDYMSWLTFGLDRFTVYKKQISFYMHATGLPALYAVQCKSDLSLSVRFIPEPFYTMAELLPDIFQTIGLFRALQGGKDVPQCTRHGEEKFRCTFDEYHEEPESSEKVKVDLVDPEAEQLAQRYRELGWIKADAEAEQKELKPKLEAVLNEHAADKATFGGVNSAQFVEGDSVDYGAFFRDHPELAPKLREYRRQTRWLRVDGPRRKKA